MNKRAAADDRFEKWVYDFANGPTSSASGVAVSRLYHYASEAGLIGMLRSNRLWASHAATMNDPGEIRYASKIVMEAFDEQVRADTSHTLTRLRESVANALLRIVGDARVFLGCFSEDGDLLSQWRAYADDGRGVAIGFDLDSVGADSWVQANGPAFRRRVIYEIAEQRRIAAALAAEACDYVRGTGDRPDPERLRQIQECIVECCVCFKHPAYAAEREWRAIYIEQPDKALPGGVRDRAGVPVPYVELSIPGGANNRDSHIAIREIIIGPSNDMESTERLLRDSLRQLRGDESVASVELRRSIVPYRRT